MVETAATQTRIVRRQSAQVREVEGDICILGSGCSGVVAALEAAKLGRKVILIDGLPALGGQAVNSIVGTFCGLFSNGSSGYQFTHGVVDEMLRDLGAQDSVLHYKRGPLTTVVYYDEVALGRWIEKAVAKAGITVLLGATLRGVERDGRRIRALNLATRYGDVRVTGTGFVDASGDAALTWLAGLACREPVAPIYGTQMVVVENIDEDAMPNRDEMGEAMEAKGDEYGLLRRECIAFVIPGRRVAALNMTHVETPLDPVEASANALKGKDQADLALKLLRDQFPKAFGESNVRAYGFPGIRQTRWIVGAHQLTVEEVRAGTKFQDAAARTAWPVELHDHSSGHVWQTFDEDHVHYVPLRSLIPSESDNLLAIGRCIDADNAALSSVRVMGPCMAMGAAAVHALDLAGAGSVHQIDTEAFARRVADNIERTD